MNNFDITREKEKNTGVNGGYKYKFSIIMSVYKVEEFIDEAVQSIINQTLNFKENVQIIMVDDGSPDNSGAICDSYARKYPDNIVVVHKENGGLSSARNEGLKHVEGRYVNFFDPDDTLSKNTLKNVYNFFDKHDNETNIVSIPLYLFGDKTGPHHLNAKFNKGDRIINVLTEYSSVQLSSASAFFKNEVAKALNFSTQLTTAEDAEQIVKLLIDKPFLGVVQNARYNYRRYSMSNVNVSTGKKEWYNDYLKYFTLESLHYAKAKLGYIPKFVQYTVMCDLQWKLESPELPSVLNEAEIKEYKALLDETISLIDDEVIHSMKYLKYDTKVYLSRKKHGDEIFVNLTYDNLYYQFDNKIFHKFSNNKFELSYLDKRGDTVVLNTKEAVFNAENSEISPYIKIQNTIIYPVKREIMDNVKCIGDLVSIAEYCEYEIPKSLFTNKKAAFSFHSIVDGVHIRKQKITFGNLFPITSKLRCSYCLFDDLIFEHSDKTLIASTATKKVIKEHEKAYCRELWKSKRLGAKKAVIARKLLAIYKRFHKKEVWVISDRLNKCGDNGEAFFRYLREINYKKADYYYAINTGDGYDMMKPLGRVIKRNSTKYKIIHLATKNIISSHADEFVQSPFQNYSYLYQDILAKQNFIFLQHGVIKDDLSGWLKRDNKNIRGFITSAEREYRSIIDTPAYHYTEREIWLTGLPRFDRLYNNEKKYVTLMPTWRKYLMNSYDIDTGIWRIGDKFLSSGYYNFYNSLINDERLLEACRKHGYTLCFMPHPNIIPHINLFTRNPEVKFFSINDEYREIYATSNLILSDYSSAVFDFAYMRKPLVYTHFDEDEFYAGEHIYTKGYFDYEEDGFGDVAYDYESTVSFLIEYIENDCKLKDKYRERIDNFFAYSDKNNCKRILDKIEEISK